MCGGVGVPGLPAGFCARPQSDSAGVFVKESEFEWIVGGVGVAGGPAGGDPPPSSDMARLLHLCDSHWIPLIYIGFL